MADKDKEIQVAEPEWVREDLDSDDLKKAAALSELLQQGLKDKSVLARLEKLSTAKDEKFVSIDDDMWTPGEPGTPAAVFRGEYKGSIHGKKYIEHYFLQLDAKRKKQIIRKILGRDILTRKLQGIEPGTLVQIEMTGETKNDKGRLYQWDVKILEEEA